MTWFGQVTLVLEGWAGGEMTGTGEMLTARVGAPTFLIGFKQTANVQIY